MAPFTSAKAKAGKQNVAYRHRRPVRAEGGTVHAAVAVLAEGHREVHALETVEGEAVAHVQRWDPACRCHAAPPVEPWMAPSRAIEAVIVAAAKGSLAVALAERRNALCALAMLWHV